ncbi:MAG: glycosyltransferase family 2 protein [Actinobacteria bacterium]|nr:glycosyltransferase family 2 protein [Actinomycetota bacterium]
MHSIDRPRTLRIQSILYGNPPEDIVRAAEAVANSVRVAREAGSIGEWTLAFGDSSAEPVLDEEALSRIEEVVEEFAGRVEYLFFGSNLGHGGGHNRLIDGSESDLLLVLNPDGIVAPGTIDALARAVVGDVAAADARQIPVEHPKEFDEGTGEQSWASGACLLTTRAAFEQIGGFDHETFFMYCDDVDYSWRLKLAGYRVVFQPAARLFHDKRLTTTGDWMPGEAEVYYSAEAALLLAHKYSRPDIVESILAAFRSGDDEATSRAATEYETRQQLGKLPTPVDAEHAVAQFTNGNYAIHRY